MQPGFEPEGQLIVGVFSVDTRQARESFRKLAQLDFDVALFGHGPPLDRDASRAFRRAGGESWLGPPDARA